MLRQLNKIDRISDPATKIDALLVYAQVLIYTDKATAFQLAHQALDLATALADSADTKIRLARANAVCGYSQYLRYQLEPALRFSAQSLLLYQQLKLESTTVDAMLTIAWVNIHAGDLAMASSYASDALNIARILADENRQARALDAQGVIQWLLGNETQCHAAYAQAFNHARAQDNPQVWMVLKNNYAHALIGLGDHTQAAQLAQQSLDIAQQYHLVDESLIFACTLANAHASNGQHQLAGQILSDAQQSPEAELTNIPRAYLLLERASLLLANGEPKAAIQVSQTGIALAKENHDHQLVVDFLQNQSDAYAALQDHQSAFETQKLLNLAQDNLNQTNLDLKMALLAVEKQIQLYSQKEELSLLGSASPSSHPSNPLIPASRGSQTPRWDCSFASLLIMDPDEVTLEGLKSLFAHSNAKVLATTASAREAAILTASLEPALLLCEWSEGEDDTVSMLQKVRARFPELPVVIYTHQLHPEITASAEANHVSGFYLKGGNFKHLLSYLNKVYNHEVSLDTLSVRRLMRKNEPSTDLLSSSIRLTYRQQAIADLLSKGYLYRNIAQMLHLSERTIKREAKIMMQELGQKNRNSLEHFFRAEKITTAG